MGGNKKKYEFTHLDTLTDVNMITRKMVWKLNFWFWFHFFFFNLLENEVIIQAAT